MLEIAGHRLIADDMRIDALKQEIIREDHPLERPHRIGCAVRISPADDSRPLPGDEQVVPQINRSGVRPADEPVRVEGGPQRRKLATQVRFELAHVVPEFQPGEVFDVPVQPGILIIIERWGGDFDGVGNVAKSVPLFHFVDEPLWIGRIRGDFPFGTINEHMVSPMLSARIVNFLARKEQNPPIRAVAVVSFDALDQDVVIGDDHEIQPGLDRRLCDLGMGQLSVRVNAVDVHIPNIFV